MSNIEKYKSHPNKSLIDHIKGVVENVKRLTSSKNAELVAIFHDFGKMNPNFQNKLFNTNVKGYSNHSFLSAYIFFCAIAKLKKELPKNEIIAILVSIAKHHGDIPDFMPIGTDSYILSRTEIDNLYTFLSQDLNLPISDFLSLFFDSNIYLEINELKYQNCFKNKLVFDSNRNTHPLDFFLKSQNDFSCVIYSDKVDAASFDEYIQEDRKNICNFSEVFREKLHLYLEKLKPDTDLNKLRTKMRDEAVNSISIGLRENRVFELTSPTGSGKTLMLLALASKIIEKKGPLRIIYILPFLSITEQVESEVLKIFEGYEKYIQRIDSKSRNTRYDELKERLDGNPEENLVKEMNSLEYQEMTFTFPFVITTFVRFFETLLSNKNSELLKLPNFSHCIFLIDEIQALPPRLYGFFIAYLNRFCELFDCYAIASTATQPDFELPNIDNGRIKRFFENYIKPYPLLPLDYFSNHVFNRYTITYKKEPIDFNQLKEYIISEEKSVLIILNTIDDSKKMYDLLCREYEVILLNTHFTPEDRMKKIARAKEQLLTNNRIYVISTQLIEAGVDIDFPIVYRDFTIVSSIVQSAGRCNRNGKLGQDGKICLFNLSMNNKLRSELIYRGKDKIWLDYTKSIMQKDSYEEKSLINVQRSFFDKIQSESYFGRYGNCTENEDFLKDIKECMFNKIGQFRLIDKNSYGEEVRFYVSSNNDDNYEYLIKLHNELQAIYKDNSDYGAIRAKRKEIEIHLNKMANRIVQVRMKKNDKMPLLACESAYYNLYKIDTQCYSYETGIDIKGEEFIL